MRSACLALLSCLALACAASGTPERIEVDRNLLTGYPPRAAAGLVNAVIEIPAGTHAKWETSEDGSALAWERKDGRLRVVRYLPYPGNYGMVPATLLPEEEGGDGDPLDILVLGPARARGEVAAVRLVGVLHMLDDGERDDKLLAVDPAGPMGEVQDLAELDASYPGVTQIVETWFGHYKGPGRIETGGFGDRDEALRVLGVAERAFREARP